VSAHDCLHCGEACEATSELCAPCDLNIVRLALKDAQAERDAVIAQRNDLLDALRGIVGLERRKLLKDKAAKAWVGAALEAIARAEGRQP